MEVAMEGLLRPSTKDVLVRLKSNGLSWDYQKRKIMNENYCQEAQRAVE